MKNIRYITAAIAAALLSFSCVKDGEMLIASLDSDKGSEIMTPDGDLVLSMDKATSLALTLYWDENRHIVLSNPEAQVSDDALINAVQFSADETFSVFEEISVTPGQYSLQLICSELNGILSRLGYEAGTPSPLYIRIRTALGENTGSIYGDPLTITVTSYYVDWSFVRMIEQGDPDLTAFATLPASGETEGDGKYAGFVNVPNDWYNFYFMEGDNSIYGTENDGGDNGTLFALAATTDIYHWGCWFPEGQTTTDTDAYACWYVTMDRSEMEWSAMRIRSMWLQYGEGENDNAQFEYNSGNTAWRAVFTTTAANTAVQLDEWGTLYDLTTGDSSPVETEFSLTADAGGSATSGTLAMGAPGADSGITVPEAGTYTLILYLADMRWELLSGDQDITTDWPEDAGYAAPGTDEVYVYSLSGETPSAAAGRLTRGTGDTYSGFFNFVSGYTFKMGDTEDPASATRLYGSAPVANSEEANYRLYCGNDMYPISYLGSGNAYSYVTADFTESVRSWSSVPVENVTLDLSGTDIAMSVSATAGVYTAEPEITSWGSGIRFFVNGETLCYTDGESDGTLAAGTGSFTPSVTVEDGHEYRITLDLNEMTYEITDITGEVGPVYPDNLYAIYVWNGSCWPHAEASVLSSTDNGRYTGFISTNTVDDEFYHWLFSDTSFSDLQTPGTVTDETIYGNTNDGQLLVKEMYNSSTDSGGDGIWACWGDNFGITLLNVDLTSSTFTKTFLSAHATATVGTAETAMAFNTATLCWEAQIDIAAGSSLTFSLDDAGNYVYGGSEGVLVLNGSAITVQDGGSYLVSIDLKNYASLTYSLTPQN